MKPLAALLLCSLGACSAAQPTSAAQQIFYLHGKIIEDQGLPAVSDVFGEYRFDDIVARFKQEEFAVVAPIREAGADADRHAALIADQIRKAIDDGTPPEKVTVIGASKGAYIAALVSHRLRVDGVRYVLLAGCSPGGVDYMIGHEIDFTGEVLAIRDEDDEIAGSCQGVFDASPALEAGVEIVTHEGLRHGLIYQPRDVWVLPSIAWANRADEDDLN